jgi:hypothetical protein
MIAAISDQSIIAIGLVIVHFMVINTAQNSSGQRQQSKPDTAAQSAWYYASMGRTVANKSTQKSKAAPATE